MNRLAGGWPDVRTVSDRSFVCGHCGHLISSIQGIDNSYPTGRTGIRICGHCNRPTFLEGDTQHPGAPVGQPVSNLPADVEALYEESRRAISVRSFTSVVLACRKILMHVAVSKGAKPGQSFVSYVEHLANVGVVSVEAKGWIDHIRDRGNDANHDIVIMGKDDAEALLFFVEFLLKTVYEVPARVPKKSAP